MSMNVGGISCEYISIINNTRVWSSLNHLWCRRRTTANRRLRLAPSLSSAPPWSSALYTPVSFASKTDNVLHLQARQTHQMQRSKEHIAAWERKWVNLSSEPIMIVWLFLFSLSSIYRSLTQNIPPSQANAHSWQSQQEREQQPEKASAATLRGSVRWAAHLAACPASLQPPRSWPRCTLNAAWPTTGCPRWLYPKPRRTCPRWSVWPRPPAALRSPGTAACFPSGSSHWWSAWREPAWRSPSTRCPKLKWFLWCCW